MSRPRDAARRAGLGRIGSVPRAAHELVRGVRTLLLVSTTVALVAAAGCSAPIAGTPAAVSAATESAPGSGGPLTVEAIRRLDVCKLLADSVLSRAGLVPQRDRKAAGINGRCSTSTADRQLITLEIAGPMRPPERRIARVSGLTAGQRGGQYGPCNTVVELQPGLSVTIGVPGPTATVACQASERLGRSVITELLTVSPRRAVPALSWERRDPCELLRPEDLRGIAAPRGVPWRSSLGECEVGADPGVAVGTGPKLFAHTPTERIADRPAFVGVDNAWSGCTAGFYQLSPGLNATDVALSVTEVAMWVEVYDFRRPEVPATEWCAAARSALAIVARNL